MEKKRSSRSSKSPGTSIFTKSPLLYENYKSGCGWKLINFFDFRHVKSGNNKRLSSEKKFIRDSAGNVYTKSQLDLLKKLHEKCQCSNIVEEENPCKPKTRIRSLSSENEKYESKPVQGLLEREITRIKNLKEDKLKNTEINLGVRVNDAAQTLICSKGKDRSKQFMEALDILSSNKELFITLLQDPNSFSARKGQDFEGSKVKQPQDNTLDDLDEIVLLKPSFSSSVDDRVYLSFKHLANKPQGSCKVRETEPAVFRRGDVATSRSPESSVFRRQKRVESDVFEISREKDVMSRRYMVERQQGRSNSSPVYEVPYALNSLQEKLKERRQRLEKKRESFKLWSLDNNTEVFNQKPHSNLRSLDEEVCTGSAEYRSLRTHVEGESLEVSYLESSLAESNPSLERLESNIHDPKQEQPSPVSVLERIHFDNETVSHGKKVCHLLAEERIGVSFHDPYIDIFEKDSVYEFVKKVLKASRLNWTNLMTRCNEETSLLDEFSHGNHKTDQLLLVLDYTDEILREIYSQDIKFWPFTPSKSSRVVNVSSSLREEDLIDETMRRFDWSLLGHDSSRTLEQIIETDLTKPCLWLDYGGESEGLVSDIVEKILQQLGFEISHELRTMQRRILI